ncbi:MAG: DUF59 domain-containing protein [Saprospiraceae bacterium]|nr:DUF59 domain-containing protein [Candidatus Brachybacter algidus]
MEIDINEIRQVLSNIKDPKTGQDIVKAGLVKDLFWRNRAESDDFFQ